jgi:steroid delta-isomerase-like uncharacterized protein
MGTIVDTDGLAQRYLDAWSAHDPVAVSAFMADDVAFEGVTLGECLSGRKEVAAFVERFTETFSSDYRFTLVSEATTATSLAAEWTVSGTHDRSSPALPATGQPFTIRGATIAQLRDGLIATNRDYWDLATFLRDVGLLPG